MRFQKNIIINNYYILCNKIDIIKSKQDKLNIKKNIPSIYYNFEKSKQLVDKHMKYKLQTDQLELECEVNADLERKIKSKISTLKYKLLKLKDLITCYKESYLNGWIKLKKHNEIYEYECIKQLIDKLIINNNNQTHILFELENWKNEFNKIFNSVYAIEDSNFKEFETYACLSTEPSISIYSSESE